MKEVVALQGIFVGFAANSVRPGDQLGVINRGFASSIDGEPLVGYLEQICSVFLKGSLEGISATPSGIEFMLVLLPRGSKEATVYVNEPIPTFIASTARMPEPGGAIWNNDLIDIYSVNLGVEVKPDTGFLVFFSVRWRRGLLWDLTPLVQGGADRDFDVGRVVARMYAYLLFFERFSLDETAWTIMTAARLFPFSGLRDATIKDLIGYCKAGWDPSELYPRVIEDIKKRAAGFKTLWRQIPAFSNHLAILEHGVDRFLAEDFIACNSELWPRIEGLLRDQRLMGQSRASQENSKHRKLVDQAIQEDGPAAMSFLLVDQFRDYLKEVVYATFLPDAPSPAAQGVALGRHSVAHGAAPVQEFSEINAGLAILVIQQLALLFEEDPGEGAST